MGNKRKATESPAISRPHRSKQKKVEFNSEHLRFLINNITKQLDASYTFQNISVRSLSTIGSSFINYITNLSAFCDNPNADPRKLNEIRKSKIGKKRLRKIASKHQMQMKTPNKKMSGEKSLKVIVDAKVLEDGPCSQKTYEFMRYLDFEPPLQMCGLFERGIIQGSKEALDFAIDFKSLEARIKHKFRNKEYAVEAFTSKSYYGADTRLGKEKNYERLEFLGDSLLCFLVHLFFCKEVNENEIEWKSRKWIKLKLPTSYQSSHQGCIDLQTNLSYSGISVKYKLYEFLLASNEDKADIANYVETKRIAPNRRTIKLLGDIFEALCAAVFLDLDYDLKKTWRILAPMLRSVLIVARRKT